MNKLHLFGIFVFSMIFITCNGNNSNQQSVKEKQKTENSIPEQNFDSTKYSKNDTLCVIHLDDIQSKEIKIVEACHIFYNDSLSKIFTTLLAAQAVPAEYNFEREDTANLTYTQFNDTIQVKILYLNKRRNSQLIPDSIYFSSNILYLKEREQVMNNKPIMRDFKIEEFQYKFIFKRKSSKLKIRHKIDF